MTIPRYQATKSMSYIKNYSKPIFTGTLRMSKCTFKKVKKDASSTARAVSRELKIQPSTLQIIKAKELIIKVCTKKYHPNTQTISNSVQKIVADLCQIWLFETEKLKSSQNPIWPQKSLSRRYRDVLDSMKSRINQAIKTNKAFQKFTYMWRNIYVNRNRNAARYIRKIRNNCNLQRILKAPVLLDTKVLYDHVLYDCCTLKLAGSKYMYAQLNTIFGQQQINF